MKRNFDDAETLIRIEHLCQYFKMGSGELKAVNDISFDIKKGEVFGLVGESGCGKTTTGRAIIKLYEATSGNVWFKGTRIVAGIRSYKDNIKNKKAALQAALASIADEQKEKINEIKSQHLTGASDKTEIAKCRKEYKQKVIALSNEAKQYIDKQKKEIRKARYDQKKCDSNFAKKQIGEIKEKYTPQIAKLAMQIKANGSVEQIHELKKRKNEYKAELYQAKHTRLVTQIQMIFQDPIASLDPRMTVRDIIAEGLVIHGEKNNQVIDQKVYEMLELVGLVREHAGRYPHEFSGGQRQRIGVARSVIMRPDMIIADEPVSALDVSIQAQVINLLNELREKMGLTIMFIAHDLSVVKYFSDRIGVMYFGNMVELATSDELFAHPLHPYTKSLLSAIPLPDPQYEKRRKRISYNPLISHDYSVDKPSMREVTHGHFVFCNEAEFEQYQKEVVKL